MNKRGRSFFKYIKLNHANKGQISMFDTSEKKMGSIPSESVMKPVQARINHIVATTDSININTQIASADRNFLLFSESKL